MRDPIEDMLDRVLEICLQEKEKEETMTDKVIKNFMHDYEKFETLEDALKEAQIDADRNRRDQDVWQKVATVKYPAPTYPVEMVAATPVAA